MPIAALINQAKNALAGTSKRNSFQYDKKLFWTEQTEPVLKKIRQNKQYIERLLKHLARLSPAKFFFSPKHIGTTGISKTTPFSYLSPNLIGYVNDIPVIHICVKCFTQNGMPTMANIAYKVSDKITQDFVQLSENSLDDAKVIHNHIHSLLFMGRLKRLPHAPQNQKQAKKQSAITHLFIAGNRLVTMPWSFDWNKPDEYRVLHAPERMSENFITESKSSSFFILPYSEASRYKFDKFCVLTGNTALLQVGDNPSKLYKIISVIQGPTNLSVPLKGRMFNDSNSYWILEAELL